MLTDMNFYFEIKNGDLKFALYEQNVQYIFYSMIHPW